MSDYLPIRWRLFNRVVFLLLICLSVAWQGGNGIIRAQSGNGEWVSPWNVSLSGTATEPTVVLSPTGEFYIFWQDRLGGYMLMHQKENRWQAPQRVLVPFTNPPFSPVVDTDDFGGFYKPLLRMDEGGRLHALWLDRDRQLNYSYVFVAELFEPEGWEEVAVLAGSVNGFDLVVGDNGRLHLAYVQAGASAQFLPGVYYRQSADGSADWLEPRLIYQSNYFRPLAAGQANVRLGANDAGQVFLVWDNPLLESVFLARSSDFGDSWQDPVIIDRRLETDALESPGASRIQVLVDGEITHLVWYAGHKPRTCTIYHQVSHDGGKSWLSYVAVMDLGLDCPETTLLLLDNNGLLFLLVKRIIRITERTEIFLQAWDGAQWSIPELQESLTDYQDPETYRKVTFDCLQGGIAPGNQLFLFACGATQALDDVWLLQRPLGELADWSDRFAPPPAWSRPMLISSQPTLMAVPTLLSDAQGNRHLFWQGEREDGTGSVIYYAIWNQREWSRPLAVVELSEAQSGRYTVALDPARQRFLLVWHDPVTQELLLSQTEVASALLATDWSLPRVLVRSAAAVADLVIDATGVARLAYTIPANEGRGVYLSESADGGATWTEPRLLFDAAAAGWFGVGAPQLRLGPDDRLYLALTRQLSYGDAGLYYLSSANDRIWSVPQERFVGNIVWRDLVADRAGVVHLLWAVEGNGRTTTWHAYTQDHGATWSPAAPVTDLVGMHRNLFLTQDVAGTLYLFQAHNNTLLDRRWDGARWLNREPLSLTLTENEVVTELYACVDGPQLLVTYITRLTVSTGEAAEAISIVPGGSSTPQSALMQGGIYLAQQQISLPDEVAIPTPRPLPTVTPSVETAVVPTATPQPTPPLLLESQAQTPPLPFAINSPALQIFLSIAPALLLVTLVFGAVALRTTRK